MRYTNRFRRLWAVGAAVGATALALSVSATPVLAKHGLATKGYTMDVYGVLHPLTINGTASPAELPAGASTHHWSWSIARGFAEQNSHTNGFILDGWGGLHAFGTDSSSNAAPAVPGGAPYWPGWDIARAVLLLNGSAAGGYVLDGWGGVHNFGTAPAVTVTGYWPGWDIAKAMDLNPTGSDGCAESGYVLDGWGGVHFFSTAESGCTAPSVHVTGYWSGWNIARSIVIDNDGKSADAGYTLDGWGGMHAWCAGTGCTLPAAVTGAPYWRGWDIARDAAGVGTGSGYIVDGWGGAHSYGGAPVPTVSGYTPGSDTTKDVDLN